MLSAGDGVVCVGVRSCSRRAQKYATFLSCEAHVFAVQGHRRCIRAPRWMQAGIVIIMFSVSGQDYSLH